MQFTDRLLNVESSSLPSVLINDPNQCTSVGEDLAGSLRGLEECAERLGGSEELQQPSTSHFQTEGRQRKRRAHGDQSHHRHSSKKTKKTRRRTHSDTDLRKMRPIIASPFMPTLATQISVDGRSAAAESRRRATTAAVISNCPPAGGQSENNNNAVNFTTASRSRAVAAVAAVKTVAGNTKYGAVQLNKTPVEVQLNVGTAKVVEEEGQESSSSSEDEDEDEESASANNLSSSSSSGSSSYTRFSDLTKKQCATVAMLAVANLCSTIAFSCIAPFYPAEAQQKGMNTSEIGIVFGVFELVMFVTAPLLGKYMPLFGSKRMFSIGLLITGVTAIAFGFLKLLPAGRIFFWASFSIRCAEALGDACFVTSSFAISAKCFPGRIATIVGIMETFAGLGYTAGPVIGSVLYEYGGFQLPFFVLGVCLILATVVSYFLVEEIEDEPSEDAMGMLSMLKIPVIWIMVFAVVICAISLSFFDPTLSDHLSSFNLSTIMVGLMFLLMGGIYTITAPLWGLILDKWHCCNALMLFGSTATVLSMIFVGPSPLFNIHKDIVTIGIALAVLGIAAGALYIPTFQNCLDAVKENGYDDSFQTYGCVSGVFQSAFAFGAFIGPTLGGLSVQSIGFPWTTTIIAGVNLVFILTLLVFFGSKKCATKGQRDKEHQPLPQA